MSKLQWPKEDRYYETGVDKVAVYVGSKSEAWNGVTAVNETPSGGEPTKIYADNVVYGAVMSPEENSLTIECLNYPRLFSQCVGKTELVDGVFISQQNRNPFGFTYRSLVKNGNVANKDHYKIHLFYKMFCASSEESNATLNDSPEQKTLSFSATALDVPISEELTGARIVLDSRAFDKAGLVNALRIIENYLYGTDSTKPTIPTLSQITEVVDYASALVDSFGNSILDSSSNKISTSTFI